jgi:hypothetical protein
MPPKSKIDRYAAIRWDDATVGMFSRSTARN